MVGAVAHSHSRLGPADSREMNWVVEEDLAADRQEEGLGEGAAVVEAALVEEPDLVPGLP